MKFKTLIILLGIIESVLLTAGAYMKIMHIAHHEIFLIVGLSLTAVILLLIVLGRKKL